MDKGVKTKITVFAVISIVLAFFASITGQGDSFEIAFFLLTATGSVFFMILACYFYTKEKGLDPRLSLFGLLHIVGLLILISIPEDENNRTKNQ